MADVVAGGVRFNVVRLGPGGDGPATGAAHVPVVFVHGLVMDNLASFYFTLANPAAAGDFRAPAHGQAIVLVRLG